MPDLGLYGDNRTYPLPTGWDAVDPDLLATALDATQDALDDTAFDRVRAYYDPTSQYAGDLLTAEDGYSGGVGPNDIDPADLFAVSTLSIKITPLAARTLLRPGGTRAQIERNLVLVPPTLSITALDSPTNTDGAVLNALYEAQAAIRSSNGGDSNTWVFAAKLLARKRPYLAPVRDNVVCTYLNGGAALKRTGVGNFSTDLQVFAYLMTTHAVHHRLSELREVLEKKHGVHLERSDLRLLDVVLWTRAKV